MQLSKVLQKYESKVVNNPNLNVNNP